MSFSSWEDVKYATVERLVSVVMSSYDIVGMNENSYHMLILGFMCSVGERYQVYSNHESGAGRPDLILRPSEQIYPSYILELKNCLGRNLETVLKEALQQIEERKYATELLDKGYRQIINIALAFEGKHAYMAAGDARFGFPAA